MRGEPAHGGHPDRPEPAAPEEEGRRPGRPRRCRAPRIAVAVVLLATLGTAAAVARGLGRENAAEAPADGLPPETAEVTRETLVDTETTDGMLGYGPATTLASRLAGTLTWLPEPGRRVTRGEALYEVDNAPVVLMYGDTPAYRTMEPGAEGPDVTQLERNLDRLGYTGFTVDDAYSDATAAAVENWQEDLGLPENGVVELGRVTFAPGAVRVDSARAVRGDPVAPEGPVLDVTGTALLVTADLDAADQRLAREGADVEVTLPDDTVVAGAVEKVTPMTDPGDGAEGAEGGGEAENVLEVLVRLTGAEAEEAAAAFGQAAVHVGFTAGERPDVLTVPVAALLALAEGGYGVEVVQGGTSRYVPVTTGLFADGRVEISGDGIAEGTKVGMPR